MRGTRFCPGAALLLALTGACGSDAGPREPVLPLQAELLDEEVRDLIELHVGQVRRARGDARAHGKLGLAYEANERWDEAARSYANAAQLAPGEPLWRYHRAIALREAGYTEESLALLEECAGALPKLAAAHQRLGLALLEVGRLAESAVEFKTVRRIAPERPEGHAGLADVWLAEGRHADAAPLLEQAVAIAPSYKSAHYSLGLAYRALGRAADATRELNLGLDADPRYLPDPFSAELASYAVNYVGRMKNGVALMDAGRPAEALVVFQKAFAKRPDSTDVMNNLAAAHLELEHWEEARELLQRIIALEPDGFAAHLNLTTCQLGLGDLNEALAEADIAVGLAAQVGKTHYTRAQVLLRRGELEDAYAAASQALRLDARDPMVVVMLAEICVRLGKHEEARDRFLSAVVQLPTFLPAHMSLVATHLRLGELDEAAAAFEVAERLAPAHPRVIAMKARLQQLGR